MKNAMNINIDRKQVITNLNHKRVEFDLLLLDAIRKQAELNEAKEQWQKKTREAMTFWIQQGDASIEYYNSYDRHTSVMVRVPHTLDRQPSWDIDTMGHTPDYYQSKIASIDKTLALLNMCTDDTIKSKAYADILEFLF